MKNKGKPFHDISDHSPRSILTRSCLSFSDRKGHSAELKMRQGWGYYDTNIEEYLDAFGIDVIEPREVWILIGILEKFGQCCKERDVFYFWIADQDERFLKGGH